MSREQSVRTLLFALSAAVFVAGLPFILSFALGYRFDPRTFSFSRGGLLLVKTQPAGAQVYLNHARLEHRTPVTLNELDPGLYDVRLELEGHYPYHRQVRVDAGKVARLDRVILFAVQPDIRKLNKEKVSSFFLDETRKLVYYVDLESRLVYRSDPEGDHFREVAGFPPMLPAPEEWRLSPDRTRLFYHNRRELAGIDLLPEAERVSRQQMAAVSFGRERIVDAFWYSDSYHVLVITDKRILITELAPRAVPVELVRLQTTRPGYAYDRQSDILYFVDDQEGPDGKRYDNVFKLELRREFPLDELIGLKADE